ncbi:acyl esterase [Streptomyces sp. AV19]|uniref:CocE/NonD family hydrolase n=1 Tax=Streptomyces sp. AV19 TaxID=2793068 RepID=UPI0018FECE9B|nr:CocE/NonD family hydrolase [Streptomyces sp. AV19]MBH1937448.1 acyl esterase [Streptomyces sp. AV19]MDG4533779.1 acyl esterase [Streptomyces sp. AV19]
MRAVRALLAAVLAAVLVALSSAAPAAGRPSAGGPLLTAIRTAPGVWLRAEVYRPPGPGPHPLIVMPGPFLLPADIYAVPALRFAAAGFVVVTYQPRGFLGSSGSFGLADAEDVADASRVIDWAVRHTAADAHRVGFCGVSYGAGISLRTAATDRRVRTVASLAGWSDLFEVMYGGGTRRLEASLLQGVVGLVEARPGPEVLRAVRDFLSGPAPTPYLRSFARARSPMTYLDRLNENGPHILMAQTWLDPGQSPNGIGRFFEGLTAPKRLEYRRGDHATQVLPGLVLPGTPTWESARRWFERWLQGRRNGIDDQPPLLLEVRGHGLGHPEEHHAAAWPATAGPDAPPLEPLTGADPTINARADSGANGGVMLASGLLDQLLGLPPLAVPRLLAPGAAAVWQTAPGRRARHLRGIPALRTVVTPSAPEGTLIAYLYDMGPTGVGQLISHAPYSFTHHTPGTDLEVGLDLFATAYDVPAGHRLALVIDGADPLYMSRNPVGSTLTVHTARTTLALPVRQALASSPSTARIRSRTSGSVMTPSPPTS